MTKKPPLGNGKKSSVMLEFGALVEKGARVAPGAVVHAGRRVRLQRVQRADGEEQALPGLVQARDLLDHRGDARLEPGVRGGRPGARRPN